MIKNKTIFFYFVLQGLLWPLSLMAPRVRRDGLGHGLDAHHLHIRRKRSLTAHRPILQSDKQI